MEGGAMRQRRVSRSILFTLPALLALGTGAAASVDQKLLPLIPPDATIVAQVTYGTEPTFLVLTRNNTADLMDLQSISGVDTTRTIARTIFVGARSGQGLISEHSLLASGQFDTGHIFKAAIENGAKETEYMGIPILTIRPLDRDKSISRDLRWLAFIDSQIALFGTIAMVHEELDRYLAGSPEDAILMGKLSRLRSTDQSWCVLTPTVYNKEIVRRTLATFDPVLGQPDHDDDGLILGIHFGKRIEIEYEIVPNSIDADAQLKTRPEDSQTMQSDASPLASHFFRTNSTTLHNVIRFSKKQYDAFIAQERAREQARGSGRSN